MQVKDNCTMTRNKPRLQIALYARPKYPDTYHWALFISPKSSSKQYGRNNDDAARVTKYHVKNTLSSIEGRQVTDRWHYETKSIPDVTQEHLLLARFIIAKVIAPEDTIDDIIGAVPITQVDFLGLPTDPSPFTCRTWAQAAVEGLKRQGVVAGLDDWEVIQEKAVEYVERKKKEGRWRAGRLGKVEVPMLDLLTGKEIVA